MVSFARLAARQLGQAKRRDRYRWCRLPPRKRPHCKTRWFAARLHALGVAMLPCLGVAMLCGGHHHGGKMWRSRLPVGSELLVRARQKLQLLLYYNNNNYYYYYYYTTTTSTTTIQLVRLQLVLWAPEGDVPGNVPANVRHFDCLHPPRSDRFCMQK